MPKKTASPKTAKPYPKAEIYARGKQRSFTGANLDQIGFPLGGIGAGNINLGGSGNLKNFSIFNKPALGQQPRAFASIYAKPKGKEAVTRVIEGPVTHSRIYSNGKHSHGGAAPDGFPRMAKATFRGEFPFATIDFADPELPLKVSMEAFSPFVPLDVKNSALPSAILKYTFKNPAKTTVDAQFAFSMQSPILRPHVVSVWINREGSKISGKRGTSVAGLEYTNTSFPEGDPKQGTFVVSTPEKDAILQETWYTAHSHMFILWKELSAGKLSARRVPEPATPDAKPYEPEGGSIGVSFSLRPSESKTIPVIISWHMPNPDETRAVHPDEIKEFEEKEKQAASASCCSDSACGCGPAKDPRKWRPYYAAHFKDAFDVAEYVGRNIATLESRTRKFHDLLFGSTMPSVVLDAVSANIAILKTPTSLLTDTGQFWAWEGCFCESGCCYGSCTHVWNYAQALPHLFPALERTLRTAELEHSMNEQGRVQFRSSLPVGKVEQTFHAASDGQLGGIMKVYREWQISGDDAWLKKMYPLAKKSLEYCIASWDPDRRGALYESHHNTYDIEFWGPDSMCTSFYLGALRAIVEMARYLGVESDATAYGELADKGLKLVNKELFNGEYYAQKIMWTGLKTNLSDMPHWKDVKGEVRELTEKEGPPFQYGKGCLSDGVIGQWFTEMIGLSDALDPARARKHLESVFKYNFQSDLRTHSNPCRPTYAMNDEAGLLLCSWPKGGQLSLPFFYATEVWTGIEYQVASHMTYVGLIDEALTIVKAVRDRYEGFKRNPWDEYECGSYYARAMAVYGVFLGLGGFRYSAVTKAVTIDPRLKDAKMASFFSIDSGWGKYTITRTGGKTSVTFEIEEGSMEIRKVMLPIAGAKAPKNMRIAGSHGEITGTTKAGLIEVTLRDPAVAGPGSPVTIQIS